MNVLVNVKHSVNFSAVQTKGNKRSVGLRIVTVPRSVKKMRTKKRDWRTLTARTVLEVKDMDHR